MSLRNCVKLFFLLFSVSCVTEASKLTVNRATSEPVRFVFRANCAVNGTVRVGQTCQTMWTVPPGWRYTVIANSSDDDSKCLNGHTQSHSFSAHPGNVLYSGQTLSTTAKLKQQITWLNSALCWVGYTVEAVMVDETLARNANMSIQHIRSSDFKWGVWTRAKIKSNPWSAYVSNASSFSMVGVANAAGSLQSVTLDVVDNIDMLPGDIKRLFTVDNGNTGSGTVKITKSGDVAADIDVYKNGSSVKGCDGTFKVGGEYCDVRAVTSLGWYGVRHGVININLTIN